jgi:uncharacterized protein YraI
MTTRHLSKLHLALIAIMLMLFGIPSFDSIRHDLAAAPSQVYVEALDWLNVRYGPDIHYPRIGTIEKGTQYAVIRRTESSSWLEIIYPQFAGGRGWVYHDAVTLTGSLNDIPVADETTSSAGYPTLTPTSAVVVTSAPVWTVTPIGILQSRLDGLSNDIYQYLLSKQFEPGTEKVGSAFIMDLQTGERYSINPGIAYSGMSLIKLPILVAVYRKIATIPTSDQAQQMALMIICSENSASNELLSLLGDGDMVRGAKYVTDTLQALGLRDTYLAGPFAVESNPTSTPPPVTGRKTTADQTSTTPDQLNQATPADLGWLLSDIYQCATDGTGPLIATFPEAMTAQKCRAILRILSSDDIPAMLRAGVPPGIQVAHKHGWVDEVHGDAGIVFTPGGDYVLVVMLRNKRWLNYEESFPTIAEISRMVYNTYNPADILDQTHTAPVPQCGLGSIDPQLFTDLRSGSLPPIR